MKLIKFDLNHPNVLNAGLIGIDEAGRGALAGPVIAGCVWLSPEFYKQKKFPPDLNQINDSKLLDESTRTHCFQFIKKLEEKNLLITSWGEGTLKEIEIHNILGATRIAMQRSLESVLNKFPYKDNIPSSSDLPLWEKPIDNEVDILIDGRPLKPFSYKHLAYTKGDSKSLAIAMASIIAKYTRDQIMQNLSPDFPEYNFHQHKGYGTISHRNILKEKGYSKIHRISFLKKILSSE